MIRIITFKQVVALIGLLCFLLLLPISWRDFQPDGHSAAWAYSQPSAALNPRQNQIPCFPGDVNEDSVVDLSDSLILLQLISGRSVTMPADSWQSCHDINNDGKIGLAEVLFTLQSSANMRTIQQGGALEGLLALSPEIKGLTTVDSLIIQLEGTDITAKPDADGYFHLTGIPEGEYTLLIESDSQPSYKYRKTFVIKNGQTFDLGSLDLSKTGSVSGVATLENSLDNLGIDIYLAGTSFLARTARDGAFRIYYVPEGFYTLVVQYPGYQRVIVDGVEVKAGQDTVLKPIVLNKEPVPAPAIVAGKVYGLDSAGNKTPLAQATVSLFNPLMMEAYRPGPNYFTLTKEDGFYVFENIPAGKYLIYAKKEGYQAAEKEVYVPGGQKTILDLVLGPQDQGLGDLTGFVVEDTGLLEIWKPLAGATVSVISANGVSTSSLTGPDGSFKFSGLPIGTYHVLAIKEGYLEGGATVTLLAGQINSLTIRLLPASTTQKTGNISGVVTDPAGNGVPDARVLATRAMASTNRPLYFETVTSEGGGFGFKAIPVGIYQLVIKKEGYNLTYLPVEVRNGETSSVKVILEPLELRLGTIAGTIKDSEGMPVSGATIIAEIPVDCSQLSMPDCAHPVYKTLSDGEGNFKLENLPALDGYLVIGKKEGYEKAARDSVNVVAGETTWIDLVINPLNSGLKLLLQDQNGRPLPNMMAKISGPDLELYQLSDNSGSVVFYLKPGHYVLTAPIEKFYRLFGDVVMSGAIPISDSSWNMPICYPDYLQCYDYGLTFIPATQSITVAENDIIQMTLVIQRFLLKPEAGAQIETPEPVFVWNAFPKAGSYSIKVYDHSDSSGYSLIWSATGLTDTMVKYNFDGQGKTLLLYRNFSWQITTDTGIISNRQSFMLVSFLIRYRIMGGLIGRDETLIIDKSGLVVYESGWQNIKLSLLLDESRLQSYKELFAANHFGELADSYLPEEPVADGMIYSIALSLDDAVKKVVFGDGGQPPDNLLSIKGSLDLLIEEMKTANKPFITIEMGGYSAIKDARTKVIYNAEEWAMLWKEHASVFYPPAQLPVVDFSKEMVIAVFAREMTTGGYHLTIEKIWQDADGLLHVEYLLTIPGPDCIVTQAMTQPFHIVKMPKSDSEVIFHQREVVDYCITQILQLKNHRVH